MAEGAQVRHVAMESTGASDGSYPQAAVIRDSAGNLYGTTSGGGTGKGVVYELNTASQETLLYTFMGGPDGGLPYTGLIRDPARNLYGTASSGGKELTGVVFALKPQ